MNEFKRKCLKSGLRIGQKIRYNKKERLQNGEKGIIVRIGVITGLYPHIFTAELKARKHTAEGYRNTIRTSFLYSQLINGEVKLC